MTWNPQADNAGEVPEIGDFVAYNYSGQIATGWVIAFGKGRWGKIFKIHQVAPKEGHISQVNGGPKCLLVLQKRDGKPPTGVLD